MIQLHVLKKNEKKNKQKKIEKSMLICIIYKYIFHITASCILNIYKYFT